MKKMDYRNVKGTKDYLPEAEIIRRRVRRTLEDTFVQYGCRPLETPILNYTDLMASKYAGGAAILEEMYILSDRGERDLALRYDLTIPFAKAVAMNPTIPLPFKRYEIGKVFRDGPIKTGRMREFTQVDVDVVGIESQTAETELMTMALDAFKRLDISVTIQYNNRKLLVGMLEIFGVIEEKINRVVLTLDKLEKLGLEAVLSELKEQGLSDEIITSLQIFLTDTEVATLSYFDAFAKQNKQIEEGLQELKELQSHLSYLNIEDSCVFNPFLARGLEIYTGTVYEIFLTDDFITSSIGSGGRYNNAIQGFMGTDKEIPTVGISFGLDVIYTALQKCSNSGLQEPEIDFYIIPLNADKEALLVANTFRSKGYNVEVELGKKKIGKALTKANNEGIKDVIIIGEDEIENNKIKIKDMTTGLETIKDFSF